jgi:hypothetical protein
MLRDLERGTVTEADHVLGDLLHRQSELAVNSPSLLRIAYLPVAEPSPVVPMMPVAPSNVAHEPQIAA